MTQSDISFGDQLFATLQNLLPKHLLSHGIYKLMRSRNPWLRRQLIGGFMRGYRIDMTEAVVSNPFAYESFNAFFTRALKPDARSVDPREQAIVSPVDGTVSRCGPIDGDTLIQAKGHDYSLLELLGGDTSLAQRYRNGHYACIYLAPYNYHRIHMPAWGTLRDAVYLPGELFSVNAATARTVPRLFARNERVVCDFAAEYGDFAMAFIGALFVGSIETVWAGEINPPPRRRGGAQPIAQGRGQVFDKGVEVARFNMGSTVVLIYQPGRMRWDDNLQAGATVRLGQRIGTLLAFAPQPNIPA